MPQDRLAEAALYDDYRRFRCSVGAGSIGVLVALAALIAADVPIFFASVRRQADCAHAAAALRHAAALAGDPLSAAHAHELAEMVAPLTASEWEVSWALSVGCLLWLGAFAALQLPVVEVEVLDVSRRMAVVPLSMLQEVRGCAADRAARPVPDQVTVVVVAASAAPPPYPCPAPPRPAGPLPPASRPTSTSL